MGVLALVWTAAYELLLREPMRTWGATEEEVTATMPGDELVAEPGRVSTRAVSSAAAPEEVWPWIVQYGIGRGGLYSYDRLENLVGIPVDSADAVVPELQGLGMGDRIRYTPEGYPLDMEFEVVEVDPPHVLVLATPSTEPGPVDTTIAWTVTPDGTGARVVLRWRATSGGAVADTINHVFEPVAWVMERKQLLGIAERAERRVEPRTGGAGDPQEESRPESLE